MKHTLKIFIDGIHSKTLEFDEEHEVAYQLDDNDPVILHGEKKNG